MIDLPTGWAWASLGDLLTGIETGKSFKCDERPPTLDEVGVVKVSAVTWGRYQEQESKTCRDADRENPALFIESGDFLFSRANTIDLVGACVIAEGVSRRVMLSDKILRFRFALESHKPWVLYLLRSKAGRQQIEALASGNQESMRNIGQERIHQIQVPLPPEREQSRIVAKLEELLSDLDDGVAELKAAQKKLAQYRQSLLKAAVEGALTAEWRASHPPTETGAQLLAHILTERRARWEAAQLAKYEAQGKTPPKDWQKKYVEPMAPATSGLPDIPQGWVWASLDQLLAQLRSGTAETSGREVTPYPVLKSSAVRQGAIDFSALNFLAQHQCRTENFLESGDLLITRLSGSVEYVGCTAIVANVSPASMQYPDRIFCGKLAIASMPVAEHIVNCMRGPVSRQRIEAAAKSTAGHKRISLSDLQPFALPLPPRCELTELVNAVRDGLEQAEQAEAAIAFALQQSAAQRQNILRAAFAGQLVPQDPADEPASVLLARIRAERAAAAPAQRPRGRKPKESAA